jgi:hypothetical protein
LKEADDEELIQKEYVDIEEGICSEVVFKGGAFACTSYPSLLGHLRRKEDDVFISPKMNVYATAQKNCDSQLGHVERFF